MAELEVNPAAEQSLSTAPAVVLRPEHAERLRERGILYAPDFVINAGGIINIAVEREPQGYDEARALARVRHISTVLHDIFDLAAHEQITQWELDRYLQLF